jgi:hypothetical protein
VNTLVFDIETVPDIELGRKLYGLTDLNDAAVAKVMSFKQQQARNTQFLPLPQQRIVSIAAVLKSGEGLHVFSLGDEQSTEKELVQRFFDGLERYSPDLVSWNGSGFDLPVLHFRALRHGISAQRYWEIGETDRDFQASGRASLEQVSQLLGFPGKLGMSGGQVWAGYQRGEIKEIRNYCEIDVLNTYLIFLRFQLLRGVFDVFRHQSELEQLEAKLEQSEHPHLQRFLAAWRATRHAV